MHISLKRKNATDAKDSNTTDKVRQAGGRQAQRQVTWFISLARVNMY